MSKSLRELGDEYATCALAQKKAILSCRQKMKKVKQTGNFKEAKRLDELIHVLYQQSRELKETAEYLQGYYREVNISPFDYTGG